MRIQHETGEIISRVNAFLGFAAVGRIKIEQKPVEQPVAKRRSLPPVDAATADKVSRSVEPIEDDGLREALQRLGQSIHAEKMKR